jgi:hypothetical protein
MQQVPKDNPLTKPEFHRRLREWLATSDENQIGSDAVYQQTAWMSVRDGNQIFELHPDTKRNAIQRYMHLVDQHGDGIEWELATTRKGNLRAVVFGPAKVREESFYLYLRQS